MKINSLKTKGNNSVMHKIFAPNSPACQEITFEDYLKVDIRIGTILSAQVFPEARNPAFKLTIDFGSTIGVKKSSAQITENYDLEELAGKQIMAVVNFPPKQIGPFVSEVLVLGMPDDKRNISLAKIDGIIPNGTRLV